MESTNEYVFTYRTTDLDKFTKVTQLAASLEDPAMALLEDVQLPPYLALLVKALDEAGHQSRGNVLRAAVVGGGLLDRAEALRAGGYAPDGQLRGFTQPINRLATRLKEGGIVPPELPREPLKPVYPEGVGYAQAKGFEIQTAWMQS